MMAASVGEGIAPIAGALVDTDLDAAGGTNMTFSGMAFGAADAARTLGLVISFVTASDRNISSVTIGGVAATAIRHQKSSSNNVHVAIYKAAVPTGTSGTVAVNLSGSTGGNSVHVALYRLLGVSTQVSNGAAASASAQTTLAVQAGDFLIAAGSGIVVFGTAPSPTMVGVVKEFDVNSLADSRHAGGSYSPVTTATMAVEALFSGTYQACVCCAAFRA